MRLGINMLNHPPQPFIIVCVCLKIGGKACLRQWEREQEGVSNNLNTLTVTHKHMHTCMPENENAPAHKHEQIRKYTLGKIHMNGNVTEPWYTSVVAISNPYQTVD